MTLTWRCVWLNEAEGARSCIIWSEYLDTGHSVNHHSGQQFIEALKGFALGKMMQLPGTQKFYGEVRLEGIKKHGDEWFNSWEQSVLRREGVKNIK